MPLQHDSDDHDRYAQVNRRLAAVNGMGAVAITFLTMASIWGEWKRLAIVAAIQVVVIAFNQIVNFVLLPRYERRSVEALRTIVNLSTSVVVNVVAGWPLPVWLWLPYVAIAFDHLDRRINVLVVAAMCVTSDVIALAQGVSWMLPVAFTVFAAFCSEVSRLRFFAMRDMVVEADEQRRQLQAANLELLRAHDELKAETEARLRLELELRQAQKLEAVGRLAAGVAHELNTPIQFVSDSVHFLREATNDLRATVETLDVVNDAVLAGTASTADAQKAKALVADADLDYLSENVPEAFDRCVEGLARIADIVRAMKDFAHPDRKAMSAVDLNRAVHSTLTIARGEYKYVAELETEFAELPPVRCHAGDINQVVLNLVVNAAHAIADVVKDSGGRGRITVKTRRDGDDYIVISVTDTGAGIADEIREHIFEPFFTTKDVGRGTGQGLAIGRSVVERHRGALWFETTVGVGTTFHVRLPIAGADAGDDGAANLDVAELFRAAA